MTVAHKPAAPINQQLVVRGCDGKAQQHLIHFGIAISPHRHDIGGQLVEPLGNCSRVVSFRHGITRAVVEQIAEQQVVIGLPGVQP